MAEVLDIKVYSLYRWLGRLDAPKVPAKLGRPEVITPAVRWKIRARYTKSYKQWGPTVLAAWARREGLGSYSPTTIDKVIKDIKEPPSPKRKPGRYEITACSRIASITPSMI